MWTTVGPIAVDLLYYYDYDYDYYGDAGRDSVVVSGVIKGYKVPLIITYQGM